jgi:hypothetical protein
MAGTDDQRYGSVVGGPHLAPSWIRNEDDVADAALPISQA